MKFANRVPSRVQQLRLLLNQENKAENVDVDTLKNLKGFRKDIMRKCASTLGKSQPKVVLHRWNASSSSSLNIRNDNPENKYSHFAPIFANFLGWILSLSAVVQLATITNRNKIVDGHQKIVGEQVPETICLDVLEEAPQVDDGKTLRTKLEQMMEIEEDHDNAPFDNHDDLPADCSNMDGVDQMLMGSETEETGSIPEGPETILDIKTEANEPTQSGIKSDEMSKPPPAPNKAYNLRQNRKRAYLQSVELEEKGSESDHSTNSHFLGNDSDESSLSSDMDTDTEEIQKTAKLNRVKKWKRGNVKAGTAKKFTCKLDGCSGLWYIEFYNDHQRLHAPGQYKCNFCDKVEENVARLCKHEIESHPSSQKHLKDKLIYCPRCPYECRHYSLCLWHFAETHIPDFEKRKETIWTRNRMNCEICNQEILKINKTTHFKAVHDTTDMKPDQIWKCNVANCSAYFKAKHQLYTHIREQHSSNSETVKPFACPVVNCNESYSTEANLEMHKKLHDNFKCEFCDVVMTYAPELAIHEMFHETSSKKSDRLPSSKRINTYWCPRCPNSFQRKYRYVQHHLKMHLKLVLPSRRQFCPICQGAFLGGPNYQQDHFQQYHNTQGLNQDQIPKCDLCPAYFVESDQLIAHVFKIHYKSKCPECGKSFSTANAFERHVDLSHPLVNLFPLLRAPYDENRGKMDNFSNSDLNKINIEQSVGTIENPKLFHCRLDGCCHKSDNKEAFKKHQKLHEPGQFKCNFCDKVEETVARLSKHEIQVHPSLKNKRKRKNLSKKTVFFCPRCPCQYLHFSAYQQHFAESHIKEFENLNRFRRTITCDICHKKILWYSRKNHFRTYHDTTEIDPAEIRKCKVENCSAYFKTKLQRYFHVRNDHGIIPKSVESDEELVAAPVEADRGSKNTSFVCSIANCEESFDTAKHLESHKKLHGSFKCHFCEVTKEYAPRLALHEMEHSIRKPGEICTWKRIPKTKAINCPHCPRVFPSESYYIRHHLLKHLKLSPTAKIQVCPICQAESKGGPSFQMDHFKRCHDTDGKAPDQIQRCDLCPAYYVKSDQLLDHKFKLHYQKKCPECGKCCKQANAFRKHVEERHPLVNLFPHLKIPCDMGNCRRKFGTEAERDHHKLKDRHFDNDDLKCSKCGKIFTDGFKLLDHMNKIHPETSHICNECGKSFKSAGKLNTHLEFHKGPDAWEFQCSTCGKKCFNKYKLAEHVRTHTKEKPFICQICGGKYAHRHNWLNHMKTKHPEEFNEMDHDSGKRKKASGNFMSRKGSKKGECITAGKKQA